jgi:hypothetical protein
MMLHQNRNHACGDRISRGIQEVATLVALICSIVLPIMAPGFAAPTASAHNLQTKMVGMFFDNTTQDMLDTRIAGNGLEIPPYGGPPEPLLRVGDKLGIVIKVVPRNGTNTGVGGYIDFYVPNGVTVVDAGYVVPDGTGDYDLIPMKRQSLIAFGDGPIGAHSTAALTGLTLGPNINGVTAAAVDATGLHRDTIAGLYGDTGIFYSTSPETAGHDQLRMTVRWCRAICQIALHRSFSQTPARKHNGLPVGVCRSWAALSLSKGICAT